MTETSGVAPFLKWAGGKRWFAERWAELIPLDFDRYIEPFLGSGAIFFALRPSRAILSDLNGDLIATFSAVRSKPQEIATELDRHHRLHSKEHYYSTRASKPSDPVERAGRFIYLNRTCWNGLYRVNQKNEFNVPIGTKTQVVLATDNFPDLSKRLAGVELLQQDFERTLALAKEGDFVFVDPPYTVKHNLNGFVKYNDRIFSWADQIRLRNEVAAAAERGAKILVTNANHYSIRELYDGIGEQRVLVRSSVLAANALHRSMTEELVVRTWF